MISTSSLRGKTPSQLTIPELKRWTSCRKGAKLSEASFGPERNIPDSRSISCWKRSSNWKKSNVRFRVQSYIDGGLEKDLIDSLISMEKTWFRIDGDNATVALDELMLCGKGSPIVEHYYLNFPWPARWHTLPHVKYVIDKMQVILIHCLNLGLFKRLWRS